MKKFWKSCLLLGLLLGGPATAERTWFMEPRELVRMKYLLEEVPAALAMDTLRNRYPQVEFFAHPTMNGFYAKGNRAELLAVRREAAAIDVPSKSPAPTIREYFRVEDSESEYTRVMLLTLVPGIKIEVIRELQLFAIDGTPEAVQNVRDLIPHQCEYESVLMDLRLLDISESGQKRLGGSSGPSDGWPEPPKETRREFVNGIEIPLEPELR